ncbi:hypothetical protein GCM10010269_00730 [Streptomyces humidus]|uniref:Uncharacterized protein n=1 Tax=Streptomyces humidus TaxID=52259 RepID=A0A918L0G5_9ACTN|nr:hypothetical protein [Streptomyces humidus]GGR66016.1 hypothetical protein GCM10010269_00730 [Streptomyces humidus]
MTTERNRPVCTRATHAPWREILRQRWSGRRDRALVLVAANGVHHVLGPGERGVGTTGDAAAASLFGRYDGAFHVDLEERPATQAVSLATPYGPEAVDVRLLWWAHDPAQVVRTRPTDGWDEVRRDLNRRLHRLAETCEADGQGLSASAMTQHLAASYALDEAGLTYRVTDVQAREEEGELRLGRAGATEAPFAWTADRREEYRFCLEAVRNGPVSLAALWLLRHPEQVSQVLDWSVRNQSLIRQETTWQDEMAGLLGKLSEEERGELSELLRDRLHAVGRRVPKQQDAWTYGGGPDGVADGRTL